MAYYLTKEQKDIYTPIIELYLKEIEEKRGEDIGFDLTETALSPHSLMDLLEKLGYKDVSGVDRNGWQMDFWIYMTKDNHRPICIEGTGISFELKLRGSDEDEIENLDF